MLGNVLRLHLHRQLSFPIAQQKIYPFIECVSIALAALWFRVTYISISFTISTSLDNLEVMPLSRLYIVFLLSEKHTKPKIITKSHILAVTYPDRVTLQHPRAPQISCALRAFLPWAAPTRLSNALHWQEAHLNLYPVACLGFLLGRLLLPVEISECSVISHCPGNQSQVTGKATPPSVSRTRTHVRRR